MDGGKKDVKENIQRNKWRVSVGLVCLIILFSQLLHSEFTEANQKESLTYIALGDSLTVGLGSSETNYLRLHSFVPMLTAHLRKDYEVYVENHGIPGITSAQLLLYLREGPGVQAKIQDADIMTITIGGNDLLLLLRSENLTQEQIESTIEQFGQQLEEILSEIRLSNKNVPIYIMGLYTPYDQDHPLHQPGKLAIPAYNQEISDNIDAFERVHLVSVYDSFLNKGDQLTHIDQNDIHPNDHGYKVIFNSFKKSLSN
jgi:lysophospholipase L1-like esterase